LVNFLDTIKTNTLIFDGSKGYMLQKFGMKGGECPELWNVEHSDIVKKIYSLYKDAGSDVIQTNTFTGSRVHLEKHGLGHRTYELNYEGTRLAREVMGNDGFVAASIGPTGKLFAPLGDLTFNEAYELFREQVKAVVDSGADIINFETFTDVAEVRVALLAAKDITNLPVICSISFEANGRTLMGTDPETAVLILKSLGADMLGTNCSFGPEFMLDIVKKMYQAGAGYISVKPNAGLPEILDGEPVYKATAERFAGLAADFAKYGARLIGGCCGTTPEFVSAIKKKIDSINLNANLERVCTDKCTDKSTEKMVSSKMISSGVRCIAVGEAGIEKIIFEDMKKSMNIGKLSSYEDKELLSCLKSGDVSIVEDVVMDLAGEDYDAIHICVDNVIEAIIQSYEKADNEECGECTKTGHTLLAQVVNEAQGYLKEPFVIETKYPNALESALRIYKGRAGVILNETLDINDNIKREISNIAKKYGALVIKRNS